MFELSQQDLRWGYVRIGSSAATVTDFGCTLTSICIIANALAGHEIITPIDAAEMFKYNLRGEIIWRDSDFEKYGIKFVKRGRLFNRTVIQEYASSENKGVILEVNHGSHWIAAVDFEDGSLKIIDPYNGQQYSGLPDKYKITGYATFEKVEAEIPGWGNGPWNKAKELGLFKDVDPQAERTLDDFQDSLVKLKKINKVSKMPAYREAAMLEKLGLLD